LFGIIMSIIQVVLLVGALWSNVFMLISFSNAYDLTLLTKLLKHILTVP